MLSCSLFIVFAWVDETLADPVPESVLADGACCHSLDHSDGLVTVGAIVSWS